MLTKLIKKLDGFAAAPVEGSIFGGLTSALCYALVTAYLCAHIIRVSSSSFPLSTSTEIFPNQATQSLLLPKMNCIATEGCYIKAQQGTMEMSNNNKVNECLYVEKGAAVPSDFRYIYYDSDPVNYFTVLSTSNDKSFALSYDVTQVTSYGSTLSTTTLKAATDDSLSTPMPYKVYKGTSIFNRIVTIGLEKEVDTWTTVTTSEASTFDGSNFGCCNANVYSTTGALLTDKTNDLTQCSTNSNNWFTTKFVPPTTYVKVAVSNPLDGFELLGLIGGWLGIVFSIAGLFYWVYEECFASETDESRADESVPALELTKNTA
jgi:hypothetical protein